MSSYRLRLLEGRSAQKRERDRSMPKTVRRQAIVVEARRRIARLTIYLSERVFSRCPHSLVRQEGEKRRFSAPLLGIDK